MAAEGEQRQPEIIIVRRHGYDDDEPHHGGVWKIAFADFMTAMMCFFLVMWLINASSEETRTALVSYFNPVKLIDRNTNRRGLEDLGYGPQSSVEEGGAADLESSGAQSPARYREAQDELIDPQVYSDERFFSEPYAVLAEISAQTGLRQNISEKGEGGEQNAGPSSGASGGDAYRDPFAPDFWTQQVADPQIGVDGSPADARKETVDELSEETGTSENRQSMPDDEVREAQAAPEHQRVDDSLAEQQPDPERAIQASQTATEEVRAALTEALQGELLAASVSVKSAESGVLISITDELEEGMFQVGSAVPARVLVQAMEKIGETLARFPGAVRINGHTDGRPFAGGSYDNWRLSTARAHAAYYMLVRGGLDETRIMEVAGFADRQLLVPEDPLADANRRIQVLLEAPQ